MFCIPQTTETNLIATLFEVEVHGLFYFQFLEDHS